MTHEALRRHRPVAVEVDCAESATGGRATDVSACESGKSKIDALTARRLVAVCCDDELIGTPCCGSSGCFGPTLHI
ncbi:hypothetical protein ACSNOI_00275 [Actinomadura kijaniata]|uniref:hypothetical protein n=1 Tax=Actinomadura kijaniata TaxID=46161 RepID=UPI003F1A3118